MSYPFGIIPPNHEEDAFNSFNCYALSFDLAAKEIAKNPEAHNETEICRKYGIFLDSITDDEIEELKNLIRSYL